MATEVEQLRADLAGVDAERRELTLKAHYLAAELRKAEAREKVASMPSEELAAIAQVLQAQGIESQEAVNGQ